MRFLFWLFLILDILLGLLSHAGDGFRASFGARTSSGPIVLFILFAVLIAGLIMYFSTRPKWISVLIVALPLLGLFMLYLFEKISGRS